MTIDPTILLAGGLGAVAGLWGQIKGFFSQLTTYFIAQNKIDADMAPIVMSKMIKEFKVTKYKVRNFDGFREFVRPIDKNQTVGFEKFGGDTVIFWHKKVIPLFVSFKSGSRDEGDGGNGGFTNPTLNISYIRGTFDIDKFFEDAITQYNKAQDDLTSRNRFFVVRFAGSNSMALGAATQTGESVEESGTRDTNYIAANDKLFYIWKPEDLGPSKKSELNVPLSKDYVKLYEEIEFWYDHEKWFKRKGIPWKFGATIYGKPGTGKSSFVRWLGQKFGIPVCIFDLASMDNKTFLKYWDRLADYAPCIALIEDIDNVFDKRTNVVKGNFNDKLTFDCFLNSLDGVKVNNGVLTFVTTNDLSKIDPALSQQDTHGKPTRPGRIDTIVEFGLPGKDVFLNFAKKILDDHPELWEQLATEGFNDKDTIAQFHSRCVNIAKKLLWEKKKNEENNTDK